MRLTVNGMIHDVDDGDGLRPLLAVLREELDVTGPKAGCQEGSCGTCTVLINGEPRRACLLPIALAADTSVTTVEGLGTGSHPHSVQRAFHEHYAAQCGYCTPGMVMATVSLLDRSPDPSEAELIDAIDGHVCRCTGYVKILNAMRSAARTPSAPQEGVVSS